MPHPGEFPTLPLSGKVIQATMLNAWVNYGGVWMTANYWKDSDGVVHLSGLIKSGVLATVALNLPVGYRPSTRCMFGTTSDTGYTRVDVDINGDVIPQAGGTTYFSLDGISFKAA